MLLRKIEEIDYDGAFGESARQNRLGRRITGAELLEGGQPMKRTTTGTGGAKYAPSTLLQSALAKRPSIEERLATGKRLRARVPHAAHAEYKPPAGRDPIAILEAQAKTRLPDLVPIRHARMLTSPFAFLRGAAAVMIRDIAAAPVTGLTVQACGDMHVSNFGVFASAERNLIFGINDFDETLPGAWEWDVKRLVASAVVCGRFLGFDKADCDAAARSVVRAYRERMREYARMGYLELWYSRIAEQDILGVVSRRARKRFKRIAAKARSRTHMQVFDKMTGRVGGQPRILEDAPLITREKKSQAGLTILEALDRFLRCYTDSLNLDRRQLLARYRILDVARKVVGVGSVGTRCWIILLQGTSQEDPLFLQFKEAQESVLAPYASPKTSYENQGRRVVAGQRLIQGAPDILLGWGEVSGIQFYVRQMRDMKGGVEFEPGNNPNFVEYCGLCGWALALAHAKSGDAAMIAGYCGKSEALDEAMAAFGRAYAKQTERDHEAMEAAVKSGRLATASKF
jgi:uncharacterized protein (DUF2252 family)